ncbi:hypothetical protein [Desulfonema magnum]|uniref:Uncharacterized protein n=1 Tax=Desulfonema magnum TaxID=45655 RepID=A0A975GTR2_9BACT|nr:hypothetical protein [Desulfonema magnum]QTA93375.1 Uncharacterized protein dnm_094760 [Desulfonema magnum]
MDAKKPLRSRCKKPLRSIFALRITGPLYESLQKTASLYFCTPDHRPSLRISAKNRFALFLHSGSQALFTNLCKKPLRSIFALRITGPLYESLQKTASLYFCTPDHRPSLRISAKNRFALFLHSGSQALFTNLCKKPLRSIFALRITGPLYESLQKNRFALFLHSGSQALFTNLCKKPLRSIFALRITGPLYGISAKNRFALFLHSGSQALFTNLCKKTASLYFCTPDHRPSLRISAKNRFALFLHSGSQALFTNLCKKPLRSIFALRITGPLYESLQKTASLYFCTPDHRPSLRVGVFIQPETVFI